jgi:AraC-like DNA-binding protein
MQPRVAPGRARLFFFVRPSPRQWAAMRAVPDSFEHASDRAEFRRLPQRAGVELYRAHIVRHAFEPHSHEAFGLGAIEHGVERFRYRGGEHLAGAGSLVLMNPDELHTGRAETQDGWRYRMVYVDAAVAQTVCGGAWSFPAAVAEDAPRARRVGALIDALWQAGEPLAVDGLLMQLFDTLRTHARGTEPAREAAHRFAPVLEHMRAHLAEPQSLDTLAGVAGLSPFHFLRAFKAQHGATPHQALMALRLLEAKRLLAAGQAPAQVAAAVGVADQSHLNRAFVRRYGVTPGRYRAQVAPPGILRAA